VDRDGGGRAASPGGWGEGPGPPSALVRMISVMWLWVEGRMRLWLWPVTCSGQWWVSCDLRNWESDIKNNKTICS
jgi:hypothetical protein